MNEVSNDVRNMRNTIWYIYIYLYINIINNQIFRYSDSQWKSLHSTVSEKSACTNYHSDKMLRFVCVSFKPITIVLSGAKTRIQQGCPCRMVSEWACFALGGSESTWNWTGPIPAKEKAGAAGCLYYSHTCTRAFLLWCVKMSSFKKYSSAVVHFDMK